jgi:hypothetical protein
MLLEVVGPHIPDDYFKSADRWELDNLRETSELKEHENVMEVLEIP